MNNIPIHPRRHFNFVDRVSVFATEIKFTTCFVTFVSYYTMYCTILSGTLAFVKPAWNPCDGYFTSQSFSKHDILSALLSVIGFYGGWKISFVTTDSGPKARKKHPWTYFPFMMSTACGTLGAYLVFCFFSVNANIFNLWSNVLDPHILQNYQDPLYLNMLTCFKKLETTQLTILYMSYILAGGYIIFHFLIHGSIWRRVASEAQTQQTNLRQIPPQFSHNYSQFHDTVVYPPYAVPTDNISENNHHNLSQPPKQPPSSMVRYEVGTNHVTLSTTRADVAVVLPLRPTTPAIADPMLAQILHDAVSSFGDLCVPAITELNEQHDEAIEIISVTDSADLANLTDTSSCTTVKYDELNSDHNEATEASQLNYCNIPKQYAGELLIEADADGEELCEMMWDYMRRSQDENQDEQISADGTVSMARNIFSESCMSEEEWSQQNREYLSHLGGHVPALEINDIAEQMRLLRMEFMSRLRRIGGQRNSISGPGPLLGRPLRADHQRQRRNGRLMLDSDLEFTRFGNVVYAPLWEATESDAGHLIDGQRRQQRRDYHQTISSRDYELTSRLLVDKGADEASLTPSTMATSGHNANSFDQKHEEYQNFKQKSTSRRMVSGADGGCCESALEVTIGESSDGDNGGREEPKVLPNLKSTLQNLVDIDGKSDVVPLHVDTADRSHNVEEQRDEQNEGHQAQANNFNSIGLAANDSISLSDAAFDTYIEDEEKQRRQHMDLLSQSRTFSIDLELDSKDASSNRDDDETADDKSNDEEENNECQKK